MKCRHCYSELKHPFLDLGSAPPSNAYLTETSLRQAEKWYPLRVLVCTYCWLVQTEDFTGREDLFNSDYAYFSSFSTTWLDHAKNYVEGIIPRLNLDGKSHVVEVAANDGYLLQYMQINNIPCTGIEPTKSTANAARQKKIPIIEEFFSLELAEKMVAKNMCADLAIANNVIAHVPDINNFVSGFNVLLNPRGVVTFEFPHLLQLVSKQQFDTIYHEHFSYLSLTVVNQMFDRHGLCIFDVEELPTHGGSLRIFAHRKETGVQKKSDSLAHILAIEQRAGMTTPSFYKDFQVHINSLKNDFLNILLQARSEGKTVAGYGAAAKANTLLNYAGIKPDLIPFIADRNPFKIGKYMPGSHIPIVAEDAIQLQKPDYIIIFPWNIKTELMRQLEYIRDWNGKFITAIPHLEIK